MKQNRRDNDITIFRDGDVFILVVSSTPSRISAKEEDTDHCRFDTDTPDMIPPTLILTKELEGIVLKTPVRPYPDIPGLGLFGKG